MRSAPACEPATRSGRDAPSARPDPGEPAARPGADAPSGRRSADLRTPADPRARPAAAHLPHLEAREPPEARGRARDEVRMLVTGPGERLRHARFRDLPDFLEPGDLLVLNTSRTIPAALPVDGDPQLALHLSSPLPNGGEGRWVIELRHANRPFRGGRAGQLLQLPGEASAELLAPYLASARLWAARLRLPEPLLNYLSRHGRPIRYGYLAEDRPIADYQTVYGHEPGSAEMPSAGRPFTPELITALVARGVNLAPVTLHTGVSSLELGERPYPERYRVPAATARLVSATRDWGGRVVAVGTTAVRALETVAGADGSLDPGEGWTNLVVSPDRPPRVADGLLTGWHEPESSHLALLEAFAGPRALERSYRTAARCGYLWHEFGDANLIL